MIDGTGQRMLLQKTRAGLRLGLTAAGAQHRWSRIVQVGQRTVKAEFFRELGLLMTFSGREKLLFDPSDGNE